MRSNTKELKSYRERRALSKTNHSSTTNAKGLFEIQQTLKNKMVRHSLDCNNDLSEINYQDDLNQAPKRVSTDCDNDDASKTKIIQKYGNIQTQITQENEQQHYQYKICQNPRLQKDKISVVSSKNISVLDKKSVPSRLTFEKPSSTKQQINNMVTPRKTSKVLLSKQPIIKTEKKATNKIQQNKFIKKMQLAQEQILKLGFEKQSEIKQLMKSIISLMKQSS